MIHAKVGAARLGSVHYRGVSVPAKMGAARPGNERVSISFFSGAGSHPGTINAAVSARGGFALHEM